LSILAYSKLKERMRRMKESRLSAVLGYIPIKLFAALSLLTFGLYPYAWAWGNTYAFGKAGGGRIGETSVKRFAAAGFLVQLLAPVAFFIFAAGYFTGSSLAYEISGRIIAVMAAVYVFLVLPMRSAVYFRIRWVLREATINWDVEGVMVGRTMTSWLALFLFGSVYIQTHINRLMRLGMPGFADASEIEMDITLSEIIDNYVTVGRTSANSAPWTKDDWRPEYGDDFGDEEEEEEEEDDG
jgi:hypothetical protein